MQRRCHAHKQRPALAPRAAAKIRHQRFANVDRQRQHIMPGTLAANQQLAGPPVDVVQLDRGDLADDAARASRTTTGSRNPVGRPVRRRSQLKPAASHRRRLKAPRQRAITQIGNRRDRPHQRRVDQPHQMQEAQKRPQRAREIPRARHAALRAFARPGTYSHPPLRAAPARARPDPPDQPGTAAQPGDTHHGTVCSAKRRSTRR